MAIVVLAFIMRLLYTTYPSLKHWGGGERSTYQLARGLQKISMNGSLEDPVDIVFASTGSFPGYRTYVFGDIRRILFIELRNKYLFKFFYSIIKSESIDIVHAHDAHTPISAILAAQSQDIPSVVHYRGYWFMCPRSTLMSPRGYICESCNYARVLSCSRNPFRNAYNTYKYAVINRYLDVLRSADLSIAISSYVQSKLDDVDIDSMVIYNPVDVNRFQEVDGSFGRQKFGIPADAFVVTFVGTLKPYKGSIVLKEIIQRFMDAFPERTDVFFVVVGGGPDSKVFEILDRMHPNVMFLGRVSDDTIPMIYRMSDTVLFPSQWNEPLGRIALETLAAGRVVIASRVGGIPDVVRDGHDGILVDCPSCVDEWVEKILGVYNDDALRRRISKNALRSARERFDLPVIAKQMYSVYKRL